MTGSEKRACDGTPVNAAPRSATLTVGEPGEVRSALAPTVISPGAGIAPTSGCEPSSGVEGDPLDDPPARGALASEVGDGVVASMLSMTPGAPECACESEATGATPPFPASRLGAGPAAATPACCSSFAGDVPSPARCGANAHSSPAPGAGLEATTGVDISSPSPPISRPGGDRVVVRRPGEWCGGVGAAATGGRGAAPRGPGERFNDSVPCLQRSTPCAYGVGVSSSLELESYSSRTGPSESESERLGDGEARRGAVRALPKRPIALRRLCTTRAASWASAPNVGAPIAESRRCARRGEGGARRPTAAAPRSALRHGPPPPRGGGVAGRAAPP